MSTETRTTETTETKVEATETKDVETTEAKKPTAKKPKFAMNKIKAVAEDAWWRKTSQKRLGEKNDLTLEQVKELQATTEYQRAVEMLMLSQFCPPGVENKHNLDKDFDSWVKGYKNMNAEFGKRMGISPKTVPTMIANVRRAHKAIAEGKVEMPKPVANPNKRSK